MEQNQENNKSCCKSHKVLPIVLFILLVGAIAFSYFLYSSCSIRKCDYPETTWKKAGDNAVYSYQYPTDWSVAELWPFDYKSAIVIAMSPKPINNAPRGGPLAEITIEDSSGLQNPDEFFNQRKQEIKGSIENPVEEVIQGKVGTIYHYSGMADIYETKYPVDEYIFTLQGSIKDNANKHVMVATRTPYDQSYSEILRKVVLSFEVNP